MTDPHLDHDERDETTLVSTADLGSASRSCLAIILVLILIVLVACIFLLVQTFR